MWHTKSFSIGHAAWLEAIRGIRGADRWRISLLTAIAALESDPHRHPQADEAIDLGLNLGEMLQGRWGHIYRIIFTIDDVSQTVHVHRIRYAAQDRLKPGDI